MNNKSQNNLSIIKKRIIKNKHIPLNKNHHILIDNITKKKCNKCIQFKELAYFGKNKSVWDGRMNICKNCKKKPINKRRITHEIINGKEHKICARCKQWKLIEHYLKNNKLWDKLQTYCKNCNDEIKIKYRIKSADKIKTYGDIYRINNKNKIKQRYDNLFGSCYAKILINGNRRADIKKKLAYDFTVKDWENLVKKQNNKCIYTGLELIWNANSGICKGSIDRIDSLKGHTLDNCQLVIYPINNMKSNLAKEKFSELIKLIVNANTHKEKPIIYDELIKNEKLKRLHNYTKNRNIKFGITDELTKDEICNLVIKYNNRCQISNIPLVWNSSSLHKASIDQINPGKGYTIDNIQITNFWINLLKFTFSTIETKFILLNIKHHYEKTINKII